jgi:hypothetical protein
MRLAIYPSDIEIIIGCSKRHANKLHLDIKEALGKIVRDNNKKIVKKHILTITEYCEYTGLNKDEVTFILTKSNKPKDK